MYRHLLDGSDRARREWFRRRRSGSGDERGFGRGHHGRVVIDRLGPPVPKTEAEIERHAERLSHFVLAGLAAFRARSEKPSP